MDKMVSINNIIKKQLNSGKRINSNFIYKSVQNYDYVSFDLFDTLVKRNVTDPTDIFSIMEKMVGKGFKDKRIIAERKARAELSKVEITIEDIYSYFPRNQQKWLLDLELDVELKTIVPNLPIFEVYKKCIADGKIVFITSDIYWPEKAVEELLKRNGYRNYKTLYLSSARQKVKSDGSLFQMLLSQEGLCANQVIHIGDSKRGDCEEPQKMGINTIRIPRYFKNIEFRDDNKDDSIELNYINNFINNTFHYTKDPYYQFGYSQFGKLLFGYVHWIHNEASKRGIKKLFFFARDGYIMKQAYESCINDFSIETRYLEVSRRSLRVPILWMDCSYERILKMVVNAKLISMENIFDGLGLESDHYKATMDKHGLTTTEIFDRKTIKNDKRLRALIDEIKSDIIENSKREYELLARYLEENDVKGKFAVVDIGYGGSMQCCLQQALRQLGIEHDITGFYLAVADFYTKNMLPGVKLDLNGYLFDFQHNSHSVDTRGSFVGLFETIFLEQDGSVKKYVKAGNRVVVERYSYEYIIDGKPSDDIQKVRRIQKGAIDFVKKAAEDEMLQLLSCSPEEYFAGLRSVGENPSIKDMKLFGDISFYDEGIIEKLASPKSILFYVIHPRQMKNDFLKCRWKTGFLKRLLKVKMPYQKIYSFLLKLK